MPLAMPDPDAEGLEAAQSTSMSTTPARTSAQIDDPALVEREDDEDYVANLPDHVAPLTEMVELPLVARQQGRMPISRGRRAVLHHLSGPFSLLWLRRARQPAGLADAGRGHDHGRGHHLHQGLARGTGAVARSDAAMTRPSKLAFIKSIWTSSTAAVGIDRRAVPRRDPAYRRHQAAGRRPSLPALPSGLRVWPGHLSAVPDRLDAGSADRCAGRDPADRALSDATDASRRSIAACSAAPVWSSSGRPRSTLVVGEGLETVLAAATRIPHNGQPLTPAWAALSTKQLAALPIVPGVERLILLVDHDANQQGQMAAARVTARWRRHGVLSCR